MKRSILRALALYLGMVFVSGIAWAQDDKSSSTQSRVGQPSTSGTAISPATPGIYSGTRSSSSTMAGQAVRLSRLMNTSLRGQSGNSLGQVQDIIVDPTSGQIQFVVLSMSSSGTGAPGTGTSTTTGTATSSPTPGLPQPGVSFPNATSSSSGGQLVAIPWRLVTSSGMGQLSATVDQTTLQSAPKFSNSSWPTMDSAWMQSVYSHFGVNASSTGAPGSSTGTGTGTGIGTGTGVGNPSTPGLPATPGAPDISPPGTSTSPSTSPGTSTGTGPGTGTGTGSK